MTCECGGVLIDVDRVPGKGPQSILAVYPPRVWAECESCGRRITVPASQRTELKAPVKHE